MTSYARVRYPSKAMIKRAVDTARELGLDVAGYEVSPDGKIRVLPPQASPQSDFDRWKDQL